MLKVSSPNIAHKTEIGGVVVNVQCEDEARQAAADILTNAAEKVPDAHVEGIVVSPMIGEGVETIIGVSRDPVLGPVVMFGLGGVFVEVLKDVTFRAAPFDIEEAHRMVREIRGYSMLEGVRGAKPLTSTRWPSSCRSSHDLQQPILRRSKVSISTQCASCRKGRA